MRTTVRVGLLLLLFVVTEESVARPVFTVPGSPGSIDEIVSAIRGPLEGEEPDPNRHLPLYLEETMCGGWDKDIDVGDTGDVTSGYIAEVHDVPGRKHWWAGDIRSGMGSRYDDDDEGEDVNDQYEFPESTEGLTTACEKGRSSIEKEVWELRQWWESYDPFTWEFIEWVPEFELRRHSYQYPEIHDPACRWRMEGGRWPDWPLTPDADPVPWDQESVEYEEPPSCNEFCQYLNAFVYRDCLEPYQKDFWIFVGWDEDDIPQFEPITVWTCDEEDEGLKYICTDEKVEEEDRKAACDAPHPDLEEWANARKCVGEQCRCGIGESPRDDINAERSCLRIKEEPELAAYESYYRLYPRAGYSRTALGKYVPRDVAAKNFNLACYGFYDEFDPKVHRTENKDRRCVINVDVEDMRESQKGKGEYKEKNVQDLDPTDEANQRPGGPNDIPGVFDKDEDTWYKKLGGAFSFINEKLFKERYDKDLGNVYLAFDELDDGEQKATPQINDDQLFAESNLMRAFDDTGNPRAYVRWWQSQQSAMNAIMRPPVLRIILPSAWFMGLDPDDPFLTEQSGAKDATVRAARNDRIELQVEADEDMLGTALAYIERSVLLHVEEEPIAVVVPMGSPVEYRARAADWCNWYKSDQVVETCDDAPESIKNIMTRLEEYADRIDEYRELRAELALSAGSVLDLQAKLLEPIATWFKDNEQRLRDIINGRERVERELVPIWNSAHTAVRRMHDRTNLPWCMNQRFTSPTYSMLDPWLPSRQIDEQGKVETNELQLPVLPNIERPQDVIIDFSAVAAMSGTLKIPVLKPVQIRIEIPSPPEPAELPELPPIADLREAVANAIGNMPEVINELETPPSMEPPAPLSNEIIDDARNALQNTKAIVDNMNQRYEKFWKSIGPLKPIDPDAPDFEQQMKEKEKKENLRCKNWDDMPCEHVEMDLMERIQRIGSRPLVQLKHDFESIGTKRMEPTNCLPEDDACHILNPERTDPGFRWEVRGSSENDVPIDELKLKILTLTQPPPIGTVDPLLLQPHDDDPSPLQSFPPIRLIP